MVVYGVGVAFTVLLVGCSDGGGGLEGGYRRPHPNVCSVPKGLDGIPYEGKEKHDDLQLEASSHFR